MSIRIALAGVAVAVGLGLFVGERMRPALALRSEAPSAEVLTDASLGPIDATPAYVSPEQLRALNASDRPARFEPDRVDVEVRRDLARADAELRASEAALESYHQGAALANRSIELAAGLAAAFSPESRPAYPAAVEALDEARRPILDAPLSEAPATAADAGSRD